MATLTRQQVTPGGITPTYSSVSGGGDIVQPGPTTFLHFKNTNAATYTVVVDDVNSVSPPGALQFNADLSVTIPATTGDKMIGPITADRFARSSDGMAAITYTGTTTNGTVAAIVI